MLFGKWSGTEVKIDGEDLLIMKESDILGVIEGKAAGQGAPQRRARSRRRSNATIAFESDQELPHMAAKDVKFGQDARERCCAASTSSPTP